MLSQRDGIFVQKIKLKKYYFNFFKYLEFNLIYYLQIFLVNK